MKSILILMNCQGEEIKNYFENIPEINDNYTVQFEHTYLNLDNIKILDDVAKCDILIINNVKKYELLRFDNIIKSVKDGCQIVKIEWIRFDGFCPLKRYERELNLYDDSITNTHNYNDFLNYKLDKEFINNNFNTSLDKLKLLDSMSDIIKQILDKLNIIVDSKYIDKLNLKYTGGHAMRYRIVLNCVKEELGLIYDDETINFFNKYITKEKFL